MIEVQTPHGVARVHVYPADRPSAALVLGHGAGGGVAARDLVTVTEAALASEISVALVQQPYRVAGRRSPAPARRSTPRGPAVVGHLRRRRTSAGCRSSSAAAPRANGSPVAPPAGATGAAGALRPRVPPSAAGRAAIPPAPSRLAELEAVTVPMLIVQGERDPFGPFRRRPAGRTVALCAWGTTA